LEDPIWIILSIFSALFHSFADLVSRREHDTIPPTVQAFARIFYGAIMLWFFAIPAGTPSVQPEFFTALAIGVPLEVIATLTYMKSLQCSPLSLTIPFLSFTPVFMLITSPLILGEFPTWIAAIGILFIVAGTYTVNIGSVSEGIFAPFKAISRERGSSLMLLTALIFSVTSVYGKVGAIASSPLFFGAVYYSITASVLLIPVLIRGEQRYLLRPALILIGAFTGVSIISQMVGITLIQVSYFISLKRISLLFSIILGWLLLKERNIRERLFGGILMVIGVIVITVWGK